MKNTIIHAALALTFSAGLLAPAQASEYRARFIDPPADTTVQYSFCGLNDAGQVVFSASGPGSRNRGFVSNPDGTLNEIGYLTENRRYTNPTHINNAGQVAGAATSDYPSYIPSRAFTWTQSGGIKELQPRVPSAQSSALSINNAGVAVGYTTAESGQTLACSWDANGALTLLQSLGGTYGSALDINDNGQITGNLLTANGHDAAVVWNPDGTIKNLQTPIGYTDSQPFAINNKGQVVGYSYGSTGNRSLTIWDQLGNATRLPGLGDTSVCSMDINDQGQVVGWYMDRYNTICPFLYSQEAGLEALMIDGIRGLVPYQINNLGAISCYGYDTQSARSRFIVLEPVPEPASIITLALGVGAILMRKKIH